MTAPLAGNVALVTDAARGIGRAIAVKLATAGCDVAVNYYNSAHEAEVLCRELRALGRRAVAIQANVAVLQALQSQIESLEQVLADYCRGEPGYPLLRTVNGIGEVLATVILLETGCVERFADAGHYASYCRCVGSAYLSNGKKKGEGNSKNGNRYLAWAFVEATNFAVRHCEPARRFYQRKKAKRNSTVAIKAVAHKLARACYHMLKLQQPFSVERCFA